MSKYGGYRESECTCSWCGTEIDDGADIACKECYETNESELAEVKKELEEAKEEIETLKHNLEDA